MLATCTLKYILTHRIDPTRDVPLVDCHCGPEGHRLLLTFSGDCDPLAPVISDYDITVAKAVRLRVREAGLIYLIDGREGGWRVGMWTASLTPAGFLHRDLVSGHVNQHGGPEICGGDWNSMQVCRRCGVKRPLTDGLLLATMTQFPAGSPERQAALYASKFICPAHGRARPEMVRTDKLCAWCGEILIRADPLDA